GGGRFRVELEVQPHLDQLLRELQSDDPLPHRQHLCVVREHGALDGVEVVRGDGADAGDLVRRDRDAQARAADQQGTVRLTGGDLLRRLDGDVRVVGAVLAPGDADVDDL